MQAGAEPRLLFPRLRAFYSRLEPLSWPLVRVACGALLIVHGWGIWWRGGGPYSLDRTIGVEL